MSGAALTGYDLTIPVKDNWGKNETMSFLVGWAKKWAFQEEIGGQTGYKHYQVRLSLHTKKRVGELITVTQGLLPAGHNWSITSKPTHEGQNFNYVMKADSRVDGPWTDKDYEEPPVLTRQLRKFMEFTWHPWQTQLHQMIQEEDDRSIKLIVDKIGDAGKSILAEYLEYRGLAFEIPPMRMMEDIMQCVQSIKPKKAYLIDLPRGMKKDKMTDFYSGLECLKNGVSYDKRYCFKKRRMDRPQVVVFTNTYPEYGLMSMDRWQIYDMNPDKSLTRHNPTWADINGSLEHALANANP